MIDAAFITAFLQVIMIDLVLAGDNAVVIGMAAAGLPPRAPAQGDPDRHHRRHGAAHLLRADRDPAAAASPGCCSPAACCCSGSAGRCTRSCESRTPPHDAGDRGAGRRRLNADGTIAGGAPRKTLRQAVIQIIIADVSMSLDNVLAVAGAAREHPTVLIFGLALSIALMGIAASLIARLLHRHRWIAWIGLW